MVNKVILVGNLGSDPEVRHLENGSVVAKFSIATSEKYRDKSGETKTITEWHDIIAWRGLAEVAEKYLTKGKMVYVEGKLTTRKWQDKDGQSRRTTEVVANNFQMLGRKDDNGQGGNNFPNAMNEPAATKPLAQPTQTPMNTAPPQAPPQTNNTGTATPDDDLPF